MRLVSRFGYAANQIRRDRPLIHEELTYHVPGTSGEEKHTPRSQNYTCISTITAPENLQREGFQPFFACQTRVCDQSRREYTKHMLRLRRTGQITGQHAPEIILFNSHDGSSSYQMLSGHFRAICTDGLVCGQSLGEVRMPHRGNVMDRVVEGAYEVVGVFDLIEEKCDAMQSLVLLPPARQALAQAVLIYHYGDEHQPVTTTDILTPRHREDYDKDLRSAYQTIQESMLKGGIPGRSTRGKRIHTWAIHSTDTDIKFNRALWAMAETLLESLRRYRFPESVVLFTAVPSPRHSTIRLFFIRSNLTTTSSYNSTTPSVSVAVAPGNNQSQLVATPVPDKQRVSFWPQHFGLTPQWATLEPRVFGWMDYLYEDYCDGIQNLYTLNNGGAFMAPEPDNDNDETQVLFNAMNGNRAEMSPEAAGIATCPTTYSRHACRTECYVITVHYCHPRDYAPQHPEYDAIMRIID